jgi:hypothetical protein
VRAIAVRRAAERGMTVGDWVAEAIVGFERTAKGRGPGTTLPATDPPPDLGQLLQRLDDRLTRLEGRQTIGFFGRLFGRRS